MSARAAVSVRRGSSTQTRPPAARYVADAAHRIGERGAVAVRHDGVRAHEDRQAGHRRVPHRIEHRVAADQLGRHENGRVVDGDRSEERSAPDRRQPRARRDLAGRVVGQTGREVERDCVGTARVDDRVQSPAEVGEQRLPRGVAAAESRSVEARRTRDAMPGGRGPSSRCIRARRDAASSPRTRTTRSPSTVTTMPQAAAQIRQ